MKGQINVQFVSDDNEAEDGLDYGGPRREFFRLIYMGACNESGMLAGKAIYLGQVRFWAIPISKWPTGGHICDFLIFVNLKVNSYWISFKFM